MRRIGCQRVFPQGLPGLAVATALVSILSVGAGVAQDRVCSVSKVEGTARIVAGEPEPAVVGASVPESVRFETGPDGRLEVRCDDGLVVTIGPESSVDAEGLLAPTDQSEGIFLRLANGLMGIVAPNRTWDRFEVETELAIASVRSTDWLAAHDDQGSAVFVSKGLVSVTSDGAEVSLSEGQGVDVTAGGAGLGDATTWPGDRVARARDLLGFDWASANGQ